MKILPSGLLYFIAGLLLLGSGGVHAEQKVPETKEPVTHVILVWLKEPGNEQMRKQFVAASRTLNELPGIINRHVGIVMPSDRKLIDDSFDVAVTVTLEDQAAFKAYMDHPKHVKVVEEQLKPLVDKVVGYDFSGM